MTRHRRTFTAAKGYFFGVATDQNRREIQKTGINIPLSRAMRIARYEQMSTLNYATIQQYKDSGVVAKWQWLCTNDDLTCDECLELDGQEFDLDERMDIHPNCRCTTLAVF